MNRRVVRWPAALVLCTGALAFSATTARALSDARTSTAAQLLVAVSQRRVPLIPGVPDPGLALAAGAWGAGGIRLHADDYTVPSLRDRCLSGTPGGGLTPGTAVPGDFLLYDAAPDETRVAMFVSATDVVMYDFVARIPRRIPRATLQPDYVPAPGEVRLATGRDQMECRLPPAAWPAGVDDVSPGHGAVAIADAGAVVEQQQFAADHPRDADTTWWHPLARLASKGLSCLSSVVGGTVQRALDGVGFLLKYAGSQYGVPVMALLGCVGGALGRTFDGRRLHRGLTALLLGVFLLSPAGWSVGMMGWKTVWGMLKGRSHAEALQDAGAGRLFSAWTGASSYAVDLLTGVEDSEHVSVGSVAFALISDISVFAKLLIPARAALHAAPWVIRLAPVSTQGVTLGPFRAITPVVTRLRAPARAIGATIMRIEPVVLGAASRLGDVVSLKPSAVDGIARSVARTVPFSSVHMRRIGGVVLPRGLDVPPFLRHATPHAADAVSLMWRPATLVHDVIDHVDAGIAGLDRRLAQDPSAWRITGIREAYNTMSPERQRAVLEMARDASAHIAASTRNLASLTQLQSGSKIIVNVASGHSVPTIPSPSDPQALTSAVLRRARAHTGMVYPHRVPPCAE